MSIGRLTHRFQEPRQIIDPLVVVAGLLIVWEGGVIIFDVPIVFLPRPSTVVKTLLNPADAGFFFEATKSTLKFIVISFVAGSSFGIVSAYIIFLSKILFRMVFPIMVFFYVIPKVALAPILLLYLGPTDMYFILFGFIFVYFPVVENTLTGLRGIRREYNDMIDMYSPSRIFKFLKLIVPASLPYIGAGLKLGIRAAVIGIVVAEIVTPYHGLGYLLIIGESQKNTVVIMGSIVMIGIVGILVYKIVEITESRVVFWKDISGGVR